MGWIVGVVVLIKWGFVGLVDLECGLLGCESRWELWEGIIVECFITRIVLALYKIIEIIYLIWTQLFQSHVFAFISPAMLVLLLYHLFFLRPSLIRSFRPGELIIFCDNSTIQWTFWLIKSWWFNHSMVLNKNMVHLVRCFLGWFWLYHIILSVLKFFFNQIMQLPLLWLKCFLSNMNRISYMNLDWTIIRSLLDNFKLSLMRLSFLFILVTLEFEWGWNDLGRSLVFPRFLWLILLLFHILRWDIHFLLIICKGSCHATWHPIHAGWMPFVFLQRKIWAILL